MHVNVYTSLVTINFLAEVRSEYKYPPSESLSHDGYFLERFFAGFLLVFCWFYIFIVHGLRYISTYRIMFSAGFLLVLHFYTYYHLYYF